MHALTCTYTRTHTHTHRGKTRRDSESSKDVASKFCSYGRVGLARNECTHSVESSLRNISSTLFYGNELIVWQYSKYDLCTANLRPSLGHICKKTRSARILFCRTNLLHVLNIKTYKRFGSRSVHDLQKECSCTVATSDEFCGQARFWIGSRHCAVAFSWQVTKSTQT